MYTMQNDRMSSESKLLRAIANSNALFFFFLSKEDVYGEASRALKAPLKPDDEKKPVGEKEVDPLDKKLMPPFVDMMIYVDEELSRLRSLSWETPLWHSIQPAMSRCDCLY